MRPIGIKKQKRRQSIKLFLLIVPFLVLTLLFAYYPLYGWVYSLYDYRPPLTLAQSEFVGFKWFRYLFQSKGQINQLLQVLKNTFIMSGLNIATSILPLIFAIMLNEIKSKKFKSIVQTLTTLPNFIGWVLVYSVAFALFSTTGMMNSILMDLNIITEPIKILDSGDYTYFKMLAWSLWKGLGWGAILYLAAIAGTDQELYEAARVDGAHRFHLMRHITLPALLPTFFVLLMLSVANFLNNGMDQYFVFQNAFNRDKIQVLDLYVYNLGLGSNNSIPLATAISILKSVVSVTLLIVVNTLSKRVRGRSIV
ncbi:sugar ABC transporter permease [Vallitalea pronyensis]|uniref:Sugar ABC transporter permease n=1 Tax=Vallitalea pronyensis TaxID=1348613 RepID=A0A8J8SJD0_9FIRM|nr:ABC transporter permease subunit [Vallitalea pronyensis]QUI25394.1 sugar ABC transporter permease [Vallitalea pronyensis]